MVDSIQPVIWMNGLVTEARRECVAGVADDEDQAVEAVQTEELVHQGLQLSQEHLRCGLSPLVSC